jgi:hypothetical protein
MSEIDETVEVTEEVVEAAVEEVVVEETEEVEEAAVEEAAAE